MNRHPRYRPARAVPRAVAGTMAGAAAVVLLAAAGPAGSRAGGPAASPAFGGRLYGVAATSASNVWAAGLDGCCGLVLHFNGSTWTKEPLAPTGFFWDTAATSATDAWVVGGSDWFSPVPLIYHWNGHQWTKSTVPAPATGGYLKAVTALSPSDAWAVGDTGGGPGTGEGSANTTLIYHWNGRQWTQVSYSAPGPGAGLNGVTATSATDAWAVGWTGNSGNNGTLRTLTLHWNGSTWTRAPSPSGKSGVRTVLQSVAALSASNAWAVGFQHADRNRLVFILHWNGKEWTKVHSPTPGTGSNLLGIAAASANDIWAVGQTTVNGGCSRNCEPGIVHWNGHGWRVVPPQHGLKGSLNILWDVAATSAHDAWAVGTVGYGTTLESHWNGRAWN